MPVWDSYTNVASHLSLVIQDVHTKEGNFLWLRKMCQTSLFMTKIPYIRARRGLNHNETKAHTECIADIDIKVFYNFHLSLIDET